MNNERGLILTRLELIGNDYDLQDWINFQIEKAGYKFIKDLSPVELLNLYDSVLCKIYQFIFKSLSLPRHIKKHTRSDEQCENSTRQYRKLSNNKTIFQGYGAPTGSDNAFEWRNAAGTKLAPS
jgi:hypothetical protein